MVRRGDNGNNFYYGRCSPLFYGRLAVAPLKQNNNQRRTTFFFSFFLLSIFFILSSSVTAQDSQQAVINTNQLTQYIQAQNDKLGARLEAKIDAQVNRVENAIKKEMQTAVSESVQYVSRQLIDALKMMVLGLAGVIILTLSVFRALEYKLSYTASVKKYEQHLQKTISDLEKEKYQLEQTRQLLLKKINELDQPLTPAQEQNKDQTEQKNNKKQRKLNLIVGIVLLVLAAVIALVAISYLSRPTP